MSPSFTGKDYSEETAKEIDSEIKRLIDEAYVKVKDTLTEKKGLLEKVAKTLLEKESLDGNELRTIISGEEDDKGKFREAADRSN